MILDRKLTNEFRTIVGLLIVLIVCSCSCSRRTTKGELQSEKVSNELFELKTGLKIEYGPNLGTTHTDTSGTKHFYVHITATITNDSTIPIHLQFALSNEYEFPTFCGDDKYKVFLLPEELTPDTATIYNNIVNGQHDFLNSPLYNPDILNKTLSPGEYCVITIGTLTPKPSNCAPVTRAVFSHDTKELYQACDRQVPARSLGANQAISTDPQIEIGVKLEYYYKRKFIPPDDGCVVIPFGQISYPGS